MKSVIEALEKRIKADEYQIEKNLRAIEQCNIDIKELIEYNERYRLNIDEAKAAIKVLNDI